MAKSSTIYNYQSITHLRAAAIGSGFTTYATGAVDDSDVFTMIVTNISGTQRTLTVTFNSNGANDDIILTFTVPGGAGTAGGTPPIDLIQDGDLKGVMLDGSGSKFFRLKAGTILKVKGSNAGDLSVYGTQMNF